MSASRERKKRLAEVKEPVVETKKTKKKISEGWIFAISIVLVLALVFGGMSAIISRIIYSLVGLAGIWGITLLFRRGKHDHPATEDGPHGEN